VQIGVALLNSLTLHRWWQMIAVAERVKHVDYSCNEHDTYITPNILLYMGRVWMVDVSVSVSGSF
jgi:hypothetical protein